MVFARWLSRRQEQRRAHALYGNLVAQARRPGFYADAGVPDTVDGRFEMIVIHCFLVLHRLKGEDTAARRLSQQLYDVMFADMDRSLREMGVGDLSVGKHVKRMAQGFHGRIAAYQTGLDAAEDGELVAALSRNLYGTASPTPAQLQGMVAYLRRETAGLKVQATGDLIAGKVNFGEPPRVAAETPEAAYVRPQSR